MQNIPYLSYLKIRPSWGSLGNDRIGNYPYQSTVNFGSNVLYVGDKISSVQNAAISKYVIESSKSKGELTICFMCYDDMLEISFNSKESAGCLFSEEDELALSIISALMDEVKLCVEDERYQIIMSKSVREKRI